MSRNCICTRFLRFGNLARLITAIVLSTLFLSPLHSAEIHKSVSVFFDGPNGEYVSVPLPDTLYSCDSTTILESGILDALSRYSGVYISRAFTDSDSGYVLVQGEDDRNVRGSRFGLGKLT